MISSQVLLGFHRSIPGPLSRVYVWVYVWVYVIHSELKSEGQVSPSETVRWASEVLELVDEAAGYLRLSCV